MTPEETAEITLELISLNNRYERAMRECFYLEGQMFRLRQKLKAISPEECKHISSLIGKNVTHKAWQNKEIKP